MCIFRFTTYKNLKHQHLGDIVGWIRYLSPPGFPVLHTFQSTISNLLIWYFQPVFGIALKWEMSLKLNIKKQGTL